jgi:hypothetical protein
MIRTQTGKYNISEMFAVHGTPRAIQPCSNNSKSFSVYDPPRFVMRSFIICTHHLNAGSSLYFGGSGMELGPGRLLTMG